MLLELCEDTMLINNAASLNICNKKLVDSEEMPSFCIITTLRLRCNRDYKRCIYVTAKMSSSLDLTMCVTDSIISLLFLSCFFLFFFFENLRNLNVHD